VRPEAATFAAVAAEPVFAQVEPGYRMEFPRDDAAHLRFHTEWWYVTGWLQQPSGEPLGFQITFFRRRPGTQEDNPSQFAAKQVLFAHAAISDPRRQRLLRGEKAARVGFGLAYAREQTLDVAIDGWSLRRESGGSYRTIAAGDDFAFDLSLEPTQAPLLHGSAGYSRKSPQQGSASYYYSLPHLRVSGSIQLGQQRQTVSGEAWLDHEWFASFLDDASNGWDWLGANLNDGGALMVSRIRDAQGAQRWAFATWRSADGLVRTFEPDQIEWLPGRRWRSPATGVEYPVEWTLRVGEHTLRVRPMMDDQENDTRATTGTLYWEGASRVLDERGQLIGRGYLELTGYGERLGM
jgi:predicted secreted hydrolase